MKSLFLFLIAAFICFFSASAQNRYQSAVFAEYDSIINVKYGNNIGSDLAEIDLHLDIFMPKGDTLNKRPVIFFTHGGSFIFGSKEDEDVAYFCRYFAKHGYVTVSANYRLGFDSFDETGAKRAVWRAVQDGRAMVRFMRSKAEEYKLDTNTFVYGGSSAGALIALQLAYYNKPWEMLAGIDTVALGGFEGSTNHLNNSSKVQGVINLCGALGDTSWIEPEDSSIVLMSMHGSADAVVPYGSDIIYLLGLIPLLEVDGSATIRERLNNLGFTNRFYTYCGGPHVPYTESTPEGRLALDTTLLLINQFLYENVLKSGTAVVSVRDVDSSDCPITTGIDLSSSNEMKIYPNPSSDRIFIETTNAYQKLDIEIIDALGKKITTSSFYSGEVNSIDINTLKSGIYLLIIRQDDKVHLKKMVKK